MDYIKRAIEEVVEHSAKTFKCILVTGARQTGKSTLVKHLYSDIKQVSFDDPFVEEQAKNNPEMFLSLNEPPVFLDEIQYVPSLFRYIKQSSDNSDSKGLFYLSGSQPFKLMELASDSLAGRVAIIELPPLSLREIMKSNYTSPFLPTMEYVQDRNKEAIKPSNIWKIIHRGGYPEMQDPDMDWAMFFSSYVKTYLERDVRELAAVQDLDAFRRFMVACAARTGQMLNYANIADEVGKDANTIKNWISILEASGIVYILEPYANSALKRAIKTPKLYFRDTGLAAYLTRWLTPETLATGAMSGEFFETFVISEILKSYSNRGLDYRYFVSYYRGKDKKKIKKNGAETYEEAGIDFIIEQDGVLYPIEIKQSANVSADMTSAFQILDKIPEKKRGTGAVICMCSMPGSLRENVLQIPYWFI
ncbi:ATP-binding protein [Butyrivibrio sp. MB2005]|uniref:ATP-binding protein n=1 Tax=Butyrivibrio sp. MB2005 TaxID=1280678 RepID=UPI00041EEB4C|nr:ATP-binding protein [Butyrivibrio sp. MB2005]